MANNREKIDTFLKAKAFAVFGASENTAKFGYKCYQCYLEHGYVAYPVNPNCKTIFEKTCYPDLQSISEKIESISVITPPAVTENIMKQAIEYGVKNIWLQPGADSKLAIEMALNNNINIIWGGSCILVELGCI